MHIYSKASISNCRPESPLANAFSNRNIPRWNPKPKVKSMQIQWMRASMHIFPEWKKFQEDWQDSNTIAAKINSAKFASSPFSHLCQLSNGGHESASTVVNVLQLVDGRVRVSILVSIGKSVEKLTESRPISRPGNRSCRFGGWQ